jgi:hypothetical protein
LAGLAGPAPHLWTLKGHQRKESLLRCQLEPLPAHPCHSANPAGLAE